MTFERMRRGGRVGLVLVGSLAGGLAGGLSGCMHTVKVDPIKVEPIDITLHIYLEADKKLDSFFNDVEKPPTPPTSPASKPSGTEGASS